MGKLFSTEGLNDSEKPDELLIDKLTSLRKTEQPGLPLTAELIKRRNELQSELNKRFAKTSDDGGKSGEDNEKEKTDQSEDSKTKDQSSDENKSTEDNDSTKTSDTDGNEAEDLESLNAIVGSAKTSTESFKQPVSNTFKQGIKAIVDKYASYVLSLESMNLADQKQPITSQPIAYVKDEVLSSLNALIAMANKYIVNNQAAVESVSNGVKTILDSLTVYKEAYANHKLSFTAKLISDTGILGSLSVVGKSDLKETSGILLKFLEGVSPLIEKLLTNKLTQIPSILKTSDFVDNNGLLQYRYMLPGFFNVQVAYEPYTNYIKTNYEDYQFLRLRVMRIQDLYDLDHIAITDDKSFMSVLDKADKILMNVGLCVDNLKTVNDGYSSLIEKLKALVYEIEKGEKEKLTDIGLDEHLQDFIKYKLATELYLNSIKTATEFLTSLITAFGILLEVR